MMSKELVHLGALANLKKLGPLYGKKLPEIRKLCSELSTEDIALLLDGGKLEFELSGDEKLNLTLEDIIVQRTEKEGLTVGQ